MFSDAVSELRRPKTTYLNFWDDQRPNMNSTPQSTMKRDIIEFCSENTTGSSDQISKQDSYSNVCNAWSNLQAEVHELMHPQM